MSRWKSSCQCETGRVWGQEGWRGALSAGFGLSLKRFVRTTSACFSPTAVWFLMRFTDPRTPLCRQTWLCSSPAPSQVRHRHHRPRSPTLYFYSGTLLRHCSKFCFCLFELFKLLWMWKTIGNQTKAFSGSTDLMLAPQTSSVEHFAARLSHSCPAFIFIKSSEQIYPRMFCASSCW